MIRIEGQITQYIAVGFAFAPGDIVLFARNVVDVGKVVLAKKPTFS